MKAIFSLFCILLIQFPLFGQIELVPYRVKNKWGYSDFEQNIKIKPSYDSVDIYQHYLPLGIEVALVAKKNKYGLIDKNEKVIIPLKYSALTQEGTTGTMWNHETDRFMVKQKNKFGLINCKDSIIIPIIYDTLFIKDDESNSGYIYFGKRNNKYYQLTENKESAEIEEAYFDEREKTSLAIAEETRNYNPGNSNTIRKWKNDYITQNNINIDSISKVIIKGDCFFFITYNKGKTGMIGQVINKEKKYDFNIPTQYDTLLAYGKKAQYPNDDFVFLVKKDNQIAVIDYRDSLLMPYKPYTYEDFNAYSIYTKKDNLFGFFRFEDQTDIEPKYEYIRPYTNLGILKIKKHGKWGYINNKGIEYFKD